MEVDNLPQDWLYTFTRDSLRQIQYFHTKSPQKLFDNHPNLGEVPKPWIIRQHTIPSGTKELEYKNLTTNGRRSGVRISEEIIIG